MRTGLTARGAGASVAPVVWSAASRARVPVSPSGASIEFTAATYSVDVVAAFTRGIAAIKAPSQSILRCASVG